MKKLILISCLLVVVMTVHAQQIDKSKQYDSFIRSFIKSTHIAGLSVAVIENGSVNFMKSYGVKSLETNDPVTNKSVFHTASVSKCFAATAIHQLVERGKLNLDDPLVKYLPYFKMNDPRYRNITLRQILAHTSGITDPLQNFWSNSNTSDSVSENLVKSLSGLTLLDEPGKNWHYSNLAYDVLADVIFKVTGNTFEDYIKKNILDPLDMKNSDFLLSRLDTSIRTAPHVLYSYLIPTINPYYPYSREHAPSSTLNSTIADMSNWAMCILNKGEFRGNNIFSEATYFNMIDPQVPIDNNKKMALGWFLESYKGLKIVAHAGGDEGYRSYLAIVPDKSLSIIFLCNSDYFNRSQLINGLFDIWFGVIPEIPPIPVSIILGQIYLKDGLQNAIDKYNEIKAVNQPGYDLSNREIMRFAFRLFNNNAVDDAHRVMQWYSEMFEYNADTYWLMGEIYRVKGEIDKAIDNYKKVLELNPDNNDAKNKLEVLNSKKSE